MCYMIGFIGDNHITYVPVDKGVYDRYNGVKRKSTIANMIGLETSREWIYEGTAVESVRW